MRPLTAISALCVLLFCSAFAAGRGVDAPPEWVDSLPSLHLYTEGVKQRTIEGDSARAMASFREAIRRDSNYAPAYYELALGELALSPTRASHYAQRAHQIDTTNKWFHQLYGQTLLYSERYDEALRVFRRLQTADPQDPDNYRIVAALYEQIGQPYSAIATLDSAEVRFGLIPMLNATKRRLLVSTRQIDRALREAQTMVDAAPYEAPHHAALASLYGLSGKDSLARVCYDRALAIDSTSLSTLLSMADYYNDRQDYLSLLNITQRLFLTEALPLDTKIKRFELFTSDARFYREFYPQINTLAQTLAFRHPRDKQVVELYAGHLIATGELEQALTHYKIHLEDTPPDADYFRTVVDIESFLQRPDSVDHYLQRAMNLFPGKPEFHIAKGTALVYAKRHDEAIKSYKNSLRYATTDSLRGVIWMLIGDVWHHKAVGDGEGPYATTNTRKGGTRSIKATYKAYDRSLQYRPNSSMTLNNYAYFLAEEGRDLERALAMSSRVVGLSGNDPTFLDTHGWVLFRLGRLAEAKKMIQQAIALDSRNSPELLFHYGEILHALGEEFLAETYWRKALERGYDASVIVQRIAALKK